MQTTQHTMKKGLIVGRFQPFHDGHLELIKNALAKVDRLYIVIGSSNKTDLKNPFTGLERSGMILGSLSEQERQKVRILFIEDVDEDKTWLKNLKDKVPDVDFIFSSDPPMTELFNSSSEFKGKVEEVKLVNRDWLSGTNLRRMISQGEDYESYLPKGTRNIFALMMLEKRIEMIDTKRD